MRRRAPERFVDAGVILGFVALALLVLRLPWGLGDGIVAGTEPCDTVPLAMTWTLGWNFDRFAAGLSGYWDAPIFYSTPGTFALSEPMPLVAALVWPAHLLGGSLAACSTLAVVMQLVLNAWFVRRFVWHLGVGRSLATVGGAIALLLPFVHQELGVLPLVPIWGIAWMFTALVDLLGPGRRPGRRAAIELGLGVGASWLCSEQLTFFAVLLLGPCALPLLQRRHFERALASAIALAVAVGAAGVLPVALPQRHALSYLGLRRESGIRRRGAARPVELVRVPWSGPIPLPRGMVARDPSDRAFLPGPFRAALAVGGIAWGGIRRPWRRRVVMLVVLTVGAAVLALGPRFPGMSPTESLVGIVPGLDRIRSGFRAVVIAQLGVVALAMIGLHAWRVRARLRRRKSPRGWIAAALAATLAVIELWPPAPRIATLPDTDTRWAQWLREEAEPGTGLAWLPFAPSGDVCDHEPTAQMMVIGLTYDHPLVNGYSSYFPGRTVRTTHDTRTLPEPRALQRLRGVHTRWIVSRSDGPLAELSAETLGSLGVAPAFVDEGAGVTVYRLDPALPDG